MLQILGCVRAVAHNGMMEIGPVAVHPDFQGQGYGSKLMDTVENRSNAEKCTVGVVSCRTDVIPFFLKRGYKVNCAVQTIRIVLDIQPGNTTCFSVNEGHAWEAKKQ